MAYLIRGAMIEYGTDFLGPVPNVVIFQFNPETLSREIQIPERPSGAASRESSQAGEIPVEKISFVAHFSAADELGSNNILARAVGIGPRLAALEKMVHPVGKIGGVIGKALDAIGDAISHAAGGGGASQPIPRESYPRILFIWGMTRVLPVLIESMRIEEQEYDYLLNPIRAEVSLSLSVITPGTCSDDLVAKGALEYSKLAKDAMAFSNLANTASQVADLIPF